MRLPCMVHWLLVGFGFTILRASAASPVDETEYQRLSSEQSIASDVDPETFLGACPEYAQYASHKQ